MCLVEKEVEKLPTTHSAGALEPYIRRVFATRIPHAYLIQGLHKALGVVFVDGNIGFDLLLSLRGKYSESASLNDVGHAVGLGSTVAHPHCVEVESAPLKLLRYHGVAEPSTRKARRLGQRTYLYCASPCSFYLKDTVRQGFVLYKSLVRRVEEYD